MLFRAFAEGESAESQKEEEETKSHKRRETSLHQGRRDY